MASITLIKKNKLKQHSPNTSCPCVASFFSGFARCAAGCEFKSWLSDVVWLVELLARNISVFTLFLFFFSEVAKKLP